MFFSCFIVFCVGSGLCEELITHSEDFCRMCVSNCVWYRNLNNEAAKSVLAFCLTQKTSSLIDRFDNQFRCNNADKRSVLPSTVLVTVYCFLSPMLIYYTERVVYENGNCNVWNSGKYTVEDWQTSKYPFTIWYDTIFIYNNFVPTRRQWSVNLYKNKK